MPRTLLCSAGTSIAQGCPALAAYQNRASDWNEETTELGRQIRERLKTLDLSTERGRVKASAELNALHRLPLRTDDEVILFATDTADGHCCADAVKEALAQHFGVARAAVERVDGLQVRDTARLRQTGLISLTRQLVGYLDDPQRRYGGGCVLNTNGGFKGIVPFFAILGMVFRAPVVYVFEFAECLITLPPLPVGFAIDLLDRALPAIQWAQARREFPPEEFFRRIPGLLDEEREWFGSFLEVIELGGGNQLATVSPLVEVLARREQEGAIELWLSPEAAARYREALGHQRAEVENMLRKLTSPLWRSQHRATKHTTDLEFYPEGRAASPWRFAGLTKGERFYLGWFTNQKGDYRDQIAKHQRADYDLSAFVKLELPAPTEEVPADDPAQASTWLGLHAENQRLREQLHHAQRREAETVAKLRQRLGEVEARAARRSKEERQKLEAQLAESIQECQGLRAQIRPAVPGGPPASP